MSKKKAQAAENPDNKPMPVLSEEDASVIETSEASAAEPELTDNDIIEGMDFQAIGEDSEDAPDAAAETEVGENEDVASPASSVSPTEAKPAEEKKTYKVGKRSFDSPEALAAYVEGLEQSQVDILDKIKLPDTAKQPEVDLETLMFENPKEYTRLMKEAAKAEIRKELADRDAKIASEQTTQKSWDDFYSKNPDLRDWQEVVDAQLNTLANDKETSNLSIPAGLELLAKRARARVNALKLKALPAETLPNAPAITSGSSGAEVPRTKSVSKPTSFIDEVRSLRKA